MRVWIALSALLVLFPAIVTGAAENKRAPTTAKTARIEPPVAARKPVRLRNHGIVRVDNYAWLRDKNWREVVRDSSRLAPAIRAYLAGRKQLRRCGAGAARRPARQADRGDEGTHSAAGHRRADARRSVCVLAKIRRRRRIYRSRPRPARRRGRGGSCRRQCAGARAGPISRSAIRASTARTTATLPTLFDDSGSESYTLMVRDLAAKRDLPDVIKIGRELHLGRQQRHLLCPAGRRAAGALRLPAPPRHRSRQRHAGLRGNRSAILGLGRPDEQRPLRRDLLRELGHQRSADRRDREAGERAPAGPGARCRA